MYFSIVPFAVIIVIAISHSIGSFLDSWRPQWTRPFVPEFPPNNGDVPPDFETSAWGWDHALLGLSVVGLTAQVVQLIFSPSKLHAIFLCISWVRYSPGSQAYLAFILVKGMNFETNYWVDHCS